MKNNYDDCLTRLLKDEGGYTNDKSDSGGPTNFGITLSDYRKYINSRGTAEDVRRMSVDQAKAIYRSKYWDALNCDNLPSGVDYTCFDYGVNSGLGRPRKALQRFKSLSGSNLINAINDERTAFLKAIGVGKNARFLKGWLNRVSRVRAHSLELARSNVSAGPVVATAGIGLSAYLSHFWHNHEYFVLGGGVIAAIGVGYLIHKLINKGKNG